MVKVFDADILIPKDRKIVVGEKEFSVSFIPMSISIRIYSIMGRIDQTIPPLESIELMVGIVADILKLSDPSITREWVMDNLDIRQLNPLFFELCNIMSSLGEPDTGKKSQATQEVKKKST